MRLPNFHRPGRDGRARSAGPPRIGLCGLLGSGNLGNDGSLEAVLGYLRADHPTATLGCLCSGPEEVAARYGIPTARLQWYRPGQRPRPVAVAAKLLGKVLDVVRVYAWVRRFDVVIVPGMGILETTLPLRPWGWPYSLLLVCAAGRLAGTQVALVSVGANVIGQPTTRRMITSAARLAHYRSYRDDLSRDAMRTMGVDTSADAVYPDLAFALAVPPDSTTVERAVGVGVMAYFGGNDDRERADAIYDRYLDRMTKFVRWLVDDGRTVRLFVGDRVDDVAVSDILTDLRTSRPGLDPARVTAAPASSLDELMRQMLGVEVVVASRYHNIVCALKLARPTLSISYAAKNDILMAEMGLPDSTQFIGSLDLDRLIEQFSALDQQQENVRQTVLEHGQDKEKLLQEQFAVLASRLFPA